MEKSKDASGEDTKLVYATDKKHKLGKKNYKESEGKNRSKAPMELSPLANEAMVKDNDHAPASETMAESVKRPSRINQMTRNESRNKSISI